MNKQVFCIRRPICRKGGTLLPVILSILVLFSVSSVAICQKQAPVPPATPTPTPTPERPREIVALLNGARLAAPELGVDTFLKVVESKKIADPVWRKEIIEEAMRMTDDVKYPVRKTAVWLPGVPVDTQAGYM